MLSSKLFYLEKALSQTELSSCSRRFAAVELAQWVERAKRQRHILCVEESAILRLEADP